MIKNFTSETFPKLRIEAYHSGIPGIALYLKSQGFKTIECEFTETHTFVYSVSEHEYTMMILRWG